MNCSLCGNREAIYKSSRCSAYFVCQQCFMQLQKEGWSGHRADIWVSEAKCPRCGSTEWDSLVAMQPEA
jgi:hypothetical protein